MVQNPADKSISFKQIKPGLSARKDHIFDMVGKGFIEWSLDITEGKNYIDSLKLVISDQTVKVVSNTEHEDPDTGAELELKDREFSLSIENVAIDADKIFLGSIIEPKEIFVFEETARCSFEGEG